jgi:hypothetical protein
MRQLTLLENDSSYRDYLWSNCIPPTISPLLYRLQASVAAIRSRSTSDEIWSTDGFWVMHHGVCCLRIKVAS